VRTVTILLTIEKDALLNLWLRDLEEIDIPMKGFMFPDRSLILTLRLGLNLGEKWKDAEQNTMTGTETATEALTEIETRGTGATSGTAEDGNQGPIGTAVPTNAIEDPTGRYLIAEFFYLDISDG
jgi:hypothetical protein